MQNDIILKNPYIFLGSRLKRLSDRFLTDAAKIHHDLGFEMFPSQSVLLAQIGDAGEISVAQLAEILGQSQPAITRNLNNLRDMGLIETVTVKADSRVRMVSLTHDGQGLLAGLRGKIWPRVDGVIRDLLLEVAPDFCASLNKIEAALDDQSFDTRFKTLLEKQAKLTPQDVEIIEYSDEYAGDFYKINIDWISENFVVEDIDKYVLSHPNEAILDKGGIILLARLGGEIVGTCALMKMDAQNGEEPEYEFTKLGVSRHYRGLKIGEKLIHAAFARAREMGLKSLFLLTNHQQRSSIHLYEKLGFTHSQEIMDKYGHEYERADVAMKWVAE